MSVCKNCGSPLKDDALFCTSCGEKVSLESDKDTAPSLPSCRMCGSPLKDDALFCTSCGAGVNEPSTEKEQSQPDSHTPPPENNAVPPSPPPAESAPREEEKKKNTFSRAVVMVFSIFISLILCGIFTTVGFVITANGLLNKNTVSELSDTVDNMDIDLGKIIEDTYIDHRAADWLSDTLDDDLLEVLGITEARLIAFLNTTDMKDYLSDKCSQIVRGLLDTSERVTFTSSEIISIIKQNEKTLFGGHVPTDSEYYFLKNDIEKNLLGGTSATLDTSALKDFKVSAAVFVWIYVALAIATVVFMLILFLINRFRFSRTLVYTGAAAVAAGVILLLSSLGFVSLRDISSGTGILNEFYPPVELILSIFIKATLISGAAFAAVGGIFTIGGALYQSAKKKKQSPTL